MQLYGAADAVEACAVAFGARVAAVREIVGGIDAEFAQPLRGVVFISRDGKCDHPWRQAAVSAAGRAPATRRLERKVLRIELGEGFAGLDVGACRGEPGKNGAAFGEKETRAFAELQRFLERFTWVL